MSVNAQPIAVFLRRPYLDALRRRASELGLKDAEAAARLLEDSLQPWLEDQGAAERIAAERELLAVAADYACEFAKRGPWDERLTLTVFEKIRADNMDLYRAAITGGHRDAVNRRVGRRIRDTVGAGVKQVAGKPVTAKAPVSSGALIARYTLLTKPRPPD